jgi:nitrogen fixation/metabolism regulation signal transduction histidine kinase
MALDIFNEEFIIFKSDSAEIISKIDRTQLIRIITNLVKNAIQSIQNNKKDKRFRKRKKKN